MKTLATIERPDFDGDLERVAEIIIDDEGVVWVKPAYVGQHERSTSLDVGFATAHSALDAGLAVRIRAVR